MFGVLESVKINLEEAWPEPRSGHRMCADENYLYIFGGYDPEWNNCLYNEIWRYNVTTEKWVRLPDEDNRAPVECASTAMLLWNDKLIIFGGSGYPFAQTNSHKLYMYCLKTYRWIDLNKIGSTNWSDRRGYNHFRKTSCRCNELYCREPPVPKYGHSMALCEKTRELVIYSGTTGRTFTEELHRFNLDELTWDLIQFCSEHNVEMPCGRYRHEVVWNDKEFYLFGGSTLMNTFEIDNVYSFDFEELLWHKHKCTSNRTIRLENGHEEFVYPEARKAHTCVIHNNFMYMVGGVSGKKLYRDIWIFCLKNKKWYISDKLQFPRYIYFHGAAMTTNGCMYVFGGIDQENDRRMNDLHKMWVCAPSLKEQAWLKVVNTLKNNGQLNKDVLIQLGVPKNFHFRLDDTIVPAAG